MISVLHPYAALKPSDGRWLGIMPEHWEVRRLKDLGYLKSGTGFPHSHQGNLLAEFPFFKVGDMAVSGNEQLMQIWNHTITEDTVNILGAHVFQPNTIVFAKVGAALLLNRRRILTRPSCLDNNMMGFLPKGHSSKWMYHWLSTVDLRMMVNPGAVPSVNEGQLEVLPVLVPPLPEQAAIVRFLDHADEQIRRYIAGKERLIALLEEERKVATEQTLRTQRAENLRLQNVANLMRRPIGRNDATTYTPVGLFNRGRGMFLKEPTAGRDLGDSDFYWIQKGDLVISGQFAWEGAIAVAGKNDEGCVASHRYPILLGKDGVLETQFLFSFLQTDWGQTLLDLHSRGAAGRNRPLNAGYLLKEKIPVPPIDEQISVVTLLEREREMRENLAQTRVLMNEYRTRLIADVVTGQLDVREAAEELPTPEPTEITD